VEFLGSFENEMLENGGGKLAGFEDFSLEKTPQSPQKFGLELDFGKISRNDLVP